ncbi:DJ-1 family glyoxalase III [Actomonas aquatica]|uniref:DJ-1 family glyoxalase III n=1 Tax=Actomonas aquatica TaxID=2866162 RepID=A0ABZ1C9T9_9BACT|nr:DJ-1 family glyoxalase III [Opitutus sp. WL0086]WRQ88451.1 DJ-1 family glyoxalase III [Opitutus sp. WL0086]
MATVLTILPEGFEEIEAITPIDLWRRAGLTVKVAALGANKKVTGKNGITVIADQLLGAVPPEATFDLLFLPGGPGVKHLRASPEVRELLGRQFAAGRRIAAICAAPLVLHDAGLLSGRRYTAHPTTETELSAVIATEYVVTDGPLTTSRGAGTALPFGLSLIEQLLSEEKAKEIGLSICAKSLS